MKYVEAPNYIEFENNKSIFLGGSIDMGSAENWQNRFVKHYENTDDVLIINPRRSDWDSSWEQKPIVGTPFHDQVAWEMDAQDKTDIIVYWFSDGSASPITLLELGAYAHKNKCVVYVTPNFYRYGNVVMFCDKHNIPICDSFEDVTEIIDVYLEN